MPVSPRLIVAVLVLAVVATGSAWVVSLAPHGGPALAHWEGMVYVQGGGVGGNDSVGRVTSRGTPLDALKGLGQLRGFQVEVEQQPWIGSGCDSAYVVAIGGQRETDTGGWNYYTRWGGHEWAWRSAGAACYALRAGEDVEWCWVERDTCTDLVA